MSRIVIVILIYHHHKPIDSIKLLGFVCHTDVILGTESVIRYLHFVGNPPPPAPSVLSCLSIPLLPKISLDVS
jgi:hypothetical protein